MIDWFHFDNFNGFIYIIIIFLALKYVIDFIEDKVNGELNLAATTEGTIDSDCNIGAVSDCACVNSNTCNDCDDGDDVDEGDCNENEIDGEELTVTMCREQLYETIVAIRKLQSMMRDIQKSAS